MLLQKYDVVRAMYYGFDYAAGLAGTAAQRLAARKARRQPSADVEPGVEDPDGD